MNTVELLLKYLKVKYKVLEHQYKGRGHDSENRHGADFSFFFFLQLLILWFLQEAGIFGGDRQYLLLKFRTYKKEGFMKYIDFLRYLIKKFHENSRKKADIYFDDEKVGRILNCGAYILVISVVPRDFSLLDDFFYSENAEKADLDVNATKLADLPLFNVLRDFLSRYTINHVFLLGKIFESLRSVHEKKKGGSFYTPPEITHYIVHNTIFMYLFDYFKEKRLFLENTRTRTQHHQLPVDTEKRLTLLKFEPEDNKQIIVDLLKELNADDFKDFLEYLARVKILDPAVGIGYFLESAAECLTTVYEACWEVAQERGFGSIISQLFADKRIFPKGGRIDIGKNKTMFLFLIRALLIFQNNLYGVDIDEVAVKIANARLFMLLFSDFGVKNEMVLSFMLPKLRFNVKCGNSLLGYYLKSDVEGFPFFTSNGANKSKMTEFLSLQLGKKLHIPSETLVRLKPFHWVIEFPDVFLDALGFDIVIGNPPYIRQEEVKRLFTGIEFKQILKNLYEPYDSFFDLSMYFILRSLQLLKAKGYHSFIITNKWLRTQYGKKMREYLKERYTFVKIIDLTNITIFKGVNIDTMVYVIKKVRPAETHEIFFARPQSLGTLEKDGYYIRQTTLPSTIWNFLSRNMMEIHQWIQDHSQPLHQLHIKIYIGIITGYNAAFVISEAQRQALVQADKNCGDFIHPLLRGKEIRSFSVDWKNHWVIVIPYGYTRRFLLKDDKLDTSPEIAFEKAFPSLYRHFTAFLRQERHKTRSKGLVNRDNQGEFWWELRACQYYAEFTKPKIVWQRVTRSPVFYLDYGNFYILDSNAFLRAPLQLLKFLSILLNSQLIKNYYVKHFVHHYGNKGFLLSNQFVAKIPVRLPPDTYIRPYEILSDYLHFLFRLKKNEVITKLEKMTHFFHDLANYLIFELYFHEKLYQSVYSNNEHLFLHDLLKKSLLPIPFESWVKLFWKLQIYGELADKESQNLKKIESTCKKIITNVYTEVRRNEEFQKRIEIIKKNKWIKELID